MLLTAGTRQEDGPRTSGREEGDRGRLATDELAGAILLAAAGREMASSLDYQATLQRVVEQGVSAVADWCVAYMVDEAGQLRRAAVAHADPAKAPVAEALRRYPSATTALNSVVVAALRTGRTVLSPRLSDEYFASIAQNEEHLAILRAIEARSSMTVPLVARGEVLGVFACYRSDPARHFSERDRAVVEDLARSAALALENARLYAAEHRARERAERLAAEREAVLRQVADGVVTVDPDGRVSFLNRAARGLLGPDGAASERTIAPLAAAALRGGTVVEAELVLDRADGAERAARASAMPVALEDGRRLGAVLTLRDVTAERAHERQRDEFFANVSHDLRAPVAVIRTSLGVVLANAPPELPEPLQRMIENADLAAERLAGLVDDLLELARARAGRIELRRARVDLRGLASRAARGVEPLAAARGQRLEVDLPRRPIWLRVDEGRLERALDNLLGNAHKHGRVGGLIRLTLTARPRAVELTVADDGPGIAIADHERVFQRFYRGDRALADGPGTGLGLPIARAMVELHGGRLELESAPSQGATFRITLPRSGQPVSEEARP